MGKFDIFKKFNSAVIILNQKNEVVFTNNMFKRFFNNFDNLEKFSHKLDYNVYALDVDDVSVRSPITHAIKSPEDFFANVTYQSESGATYYYDMNSSKKGTYNIIVFTDVTSKVEYEKSLKKIQTLQKRVNALESDNRNISKIKQQAQSQAMKLLLLNNISNIIRSSIDTSGIINSAIRELAELFAAFKAYYAVYSESTSSYEITTTLSQKDIGTKFTFDSETEKLIFGTKSFVMSCMREYTEAKPFRELVQRIIIPIYHHNSRLGVIVLLTKQKTKLDDALEVLDGVSTQLGNTIMQSELQLQLINSEKMASLGQLIAGVAHEINTPVASIKSNNEILAKLISKLPEDKIELFREINNIDKDAISRISGLVVSLRKFVRLDEAELQEADINNELDLTLNLIRHEIKNRIKIIKNYGKLPPVKCYPNMLNQVFINILVNAAHAITGEGIITIDTNYANNKLFVKIKDNGSGIKEPDKIFLAGYTTKGVGVGTGLGLAISKKIIEKHNGTIDFKTKLGAGSEFTITIPSE